MPFRFSIPPRPGEAAPRRPRFRCWAAILFTAVLMGVVAPSLAVPAEDSAADAAALPADLRQLQGWLDAHATDDHAMPLEARLAYRLGMLARRAHQDDKAVALLRGAAVLDPSYAAPQVTLAGWFLWREPSQALQSGAAALDRLARSFPLQIEIAGNALFYSIHALFFGLLATALILVGRHQRELRHMWRERLALFVSRPSASVWAWALLIAPFALGWGLAAPALVLFAMCWTLLRRRERAVFLGLALLIGIAPLVPALMGRLAAGLRRDGAPFYGVQDLEDLPYSVARHAELKALAARHPDDPILEFGLGWMARRAGDLAGAEAAYRAVLRHWPDDDRVLNNLGNLLASRGRLDDALALYRKATDHEPRNAAAFFNASQVHTRRFDYRAASEAVSKASAIDFDLVRQYQARTGDELPLVDQWLSPALFWRVLIDLPEDQIPAARPPAWRAMVEMSGWRFAALALLLAGISLGMGLWWHRRLPVRACSNCGLPVCRRCAHRQRELALCPACASVAGRAESPEFGRVLLFQQKRKVERVRSISSAALAALVPGLGLVASRRVFYAIGLLMIATLLATSSLQIPAPFPLGQELPDPQGTLWTVALSWLLLYALSVAGFLGRRPEAEPAPARPSTSRVAGPPDEKPARAA